MASKHFILRNKKPYIKLLIFIPIGYIPLFKYAITNLRSNENFKIAFSIFFLLFCVLMLLFFINAIKKTLKNTPALIIDNTGITDNITLANVGKIDWEDIVKFEILKSGGHPHVFIFVKNPEKFIKNQSWFTKGIIKQLNKDKGSPIAIDLKQVKIEPSALLEILTRKKIRNGQNQYA